MSRCSHSSFSVRPSCTCRRSAACAGGIARALKSKSVSCRSVMLYTQVTTCLKYSSGYLHVKLQATITSPPADVLPLRRLLANISLHAGRSLMRGSRQADAVCPSRSRVPQSRFACVRDRKIAHVGQRYCAPASQELSPDALQSLHRIRDLAHFLVENLLRKPARARRHFSCCSLSGSGRPLSRIPRRSDGAPCRPPCDPADG